MDTHNNIRPPATLTVLEKSRELHILLSKVTADDNLLQKTFRFTVGKAVTDHSQEIYECLAVANSLDLYDKELTQERLNYQTKAKRSVTKLLAALRVMYTISQMSSDKMKLLLDKTIEVERLLKKWIESDRNRVGASLGIVKKDDIDNSIFNNRITARDVFSPAPHVDFDILLKDSRNNLPPVVGGNKGRIQYIPPGECLHAKTPEIRYVVKSDSEREADLKADVFRLDKMPAAPVMPVPKGIEHSRAESHEITEPKTVEDSKTIEVVVRDKPIVVPDNRVKIDPIPTREEQAKIPLDPMVSITKGSTPEMLTEEIPPTSGGKTTSTEKKENSK